MMHCFRCWPYCVATGRKKIVRQYGQEGMLLFGEYT